MILHCQLDTRGFSGDQDVAHDLSLHPELPVLPNGNALDRLLAWEWRVALDDVYNPLVCDQLPRAFPYDSDRRANLVLDLRQSRTEIDR